MELRETEAKYCADLRTLLTLYVRPLTTQFNLLQKLPLAMHVEALLQSNEALLKALAPDQSSAHHVLDTRDAHGSASAVASAFIAVAPFFKLYTQYCLQYEGAVSAIRRGRQENAEVSAFLTEQAELCGRTVDDLLITPVQRLTKYPLFLDSLLRAVPPEASAHAQLLRASELVRTVSCSVDASLCDPSRALVRSLEPLGKEWLQLLAPHRQLLREFTCRFRGFGYSGGMTGYLMTDVLLLCRHSKHGNLKPIALVPLLDLLVDDAEDFDNEHGPSPTRQTSAPASSASSPAYAPAESPITHAISFPATPSAASSGLQSACSFPSPGSGPVAAADEATTCSLLLAWDNVGLREEVTLEARGEAQAARLVEVAEGLDEARETCGRSEEDLRERSGNAERGRDEGLCALLDKMRAEAVGGRARTHSSTPDVGKGPARRPSIRRRAASMGGADLGASGGGGRRGSISRFAKVLWSGGKEGGRDEEGALERSARFNLQRVSISRSTSGSMRRGWGGSEAKCGTDDDATSSADTSSLEPTPHNSLERRPNG